MSRGQGDTHNHLAVAQRGTPDHEDTASEIVCVEMWFTPSDNERERVSVTVRAYAYDGDLRNDHELVEASGETFAEPFSLDLLRRQLTGSLADALSSRLALSYRH